MTACCQFVIAGYDNGTVARFNIQSGLHRRTYAPKEGLPAHVDSGGTGYGNGTSELCLCNALVRTDVGLIACIPELL